MIVDEDVIAGTSFERLSPVANAFSKLGVSNRVQLARLALLEGVVEP